MLTCSLLLLVSLEDFCYSQSPNIASDTITNRNSSGIVSDTVAVTDTIPVPKSDIDTTIFYTADDSIRMDVVNKLVYLYGNAKITYGDVTLTAAEVEINWLTNIVSARPAKDSTGKLVGKPVFKDGAEMYVIEDNIQYNFQTKKGLISGVVTKQGEGYIEAGKVKKVEDNLYIRDAQYTTCNLADPHFYIHANKMKVIPEDKIVSGPFNMVIADVPTPLGFFLGFFPLPKRQKSGLIIPTFGSSDRGFYLREGGYYWAVNDYVGLRAIGDVYANKSYRASLNGEYRKRYSYYGNVFFSASQLRDGFDDVEEEAPLEINVRWTHGTLRKRNSNLTANVNVASTRYFKKNTLNPVTLQTGVFTSSILYYKQFGNSPFNINLALRQDQNVTTRVMNFTLPEATLAMNRIYPMKRLFPGKNTWYTNLNLAYTGNARLDLTNDSLRTGYGEVVPFVPKNIDTLWAKKEYGARHTIPISTTIKFKKTFLRYFNFTPNAVYEEFWYPYKREYSVDTNNVISSTLVNGFNRTSQYSGAVAMTTNIYGDYKFKSKWLLGMRHIMIPTISYIYKPDFQNDKNFQEVNSQFLSRYEGFLYGGPSRGLTQSISFSLNNSLEGKRIAKKDTTQTPTKFKFIDQLSISGSYNFAATVNNLSVIQTSLNSRLLNRFDLLTSATFDPYIYVDPDTTNDIVQAVRTNTFAIDAGEGLAKLTNLNFSIGGDLNPKARQPIRTQQAAQEDLNYINATRFAYVDFAIPWSLFARYNLNYSKIGDLRGKVTQSVTFNGSVNLTEKWKIELYSGYDIETQQITSTQISVHRDLHCWQMAFIVNPFGTIRTYAFSISAKASILQDLKLNKRSSSFYGNFY